MSNRQLRQQHPRRSRWPSAPQLENRRLWGWWRRERAIEDGRDPLQCEYGRDR